MSPAFIVDSNVGKLARWLRMMGYDAVFFNGTDDGQMVKIALAENRIIITRDSEFMKRRNITTGRVQAVLLKSSIPETQMLFLLEKLKLDTSYRPFSRCIECNTELIERKKTEVASSVPPRVYQLHDQYMECPVCRRIFWRGTHWQSMTDKLGIFATTQPPLTGGEDK